LQAFAASSFAYPQPGQFIERVYHRGSRPAVQLPVIAFSSAKKAFLRGVFRVQVTGGF
jgi:hypothetical protein